MSCCVKNIPKSVKKLLNDGQNVIFKGYYNKNNININKNNSATVNTNICKNKNGYNLCSYIFNYVKGSDSKEFSLETYTLSSYNSDLNKEKGVITFTNLYYDSGAAAGITSPLIIAFNVLGGNGIYSEIKTVIIDCTDTERKLYFCG
jgi:hypothetical protein